MIRNDWDHIKKEIVFRMKDKQTAQRLFMDLSGVSVGWEKLATGKDAPCQIGCGDYGIPTGSTRMYFIETTQGRGDWRLQCRNCKSDIDIFDAVQKATGCDYIEAVKTIAERLSIPYIGSGKPRASIGRSKPVPPLPDPKPTPSPLLRDWTEFFRQSASQITNPAAVSYLSSRGIGIETAREYFIGYTDHVPHVKEDGSISPTVPGIVFPISRTQWEARYIKPIITKDGRSVKSYKPKGAPSGFWNWKSLTQIEYPVYITEGIFNALSIIERGKQRGHNLQAAAIGGAPFVRLLINTINAIRKSGPLPRIIAAMDNDEGGDNANAKIKELAEQYKIRIETVKYSQIEEVKQ